MTPLSPTYMFVVEDTSNFEQNVLEAGLPAERWSIQDDGDDTLIIPRIKIPHYIMAIMRDHLETLFQRLVRITN